MHKHNYFHRDLKPENLLCYHQTIKVADFGSSCFLDTKKRLSGCFGSAYYVAPEVLLGEYNEKCDVWSVGVVLYEMLTGEGSFGGETVTDSIAATIHKEPEWVRLPSDTPHQVRHLLARCIRSLRRRQR